MFIIHIKLAITLHFLTFQANAITALQIPKKITEKSLSTPADILNLYIAKTDFFDYLLFVKQNLLLSNPILKGFFTKIQLFFQVPAKAEIFSESS